MWKKLLKNKSGLIGILIMIGVISVALLSPFLAPCDPNEQDISIRLKGTVWEESGDSSHLLGTDQMGRDILSRLIYGSRISLIISFMGTIVGGAIGITMGCFSGYYGGKIDSVIMRLVDIQLAFPFILLAIFIVSVLGAGVFNIIIVAGISSWVRYARLVRGEILSVKEIEYVEAIRSMGAGDLRIIFRHILPNIISPVLIVATLEMARIILMEAALSFLGLGVPAHVATWGRMLSEGRIYIVTNPWIAIFPGLAITLTVLGVNLFGDWLRDYLDPKLKNV